MRRENRETPKLEYHAPHLERHGTLSDLTQTGSPGSADDFILGSVTPASDHSPPRP